MRRALVLCLMICLGVIPVLPKSTDVIAEQKEDDVQKQSSKELRRQAAIREKIELMGSGAQIQAVMRGSSSPVTLKGEIDKIAAENFGIKTKDRVQQLQYSQIERVSLSKGGYKAQGVVDPVRVRRVVADIEVGNRAKIKLASSERFSGTIQSIEKESFVITSQGRSSPVKYGEVAEIKKTGLPTGTKLAIVGAAVGGVLLVFAILWMTAED